MEDDVDALAGALAGVGIADVAFEQIDLGTEGRDIVPLAGREVVEDADARAILDKSLNKVRADKAGAASYEEIHIVRCSQCVIVNGVGFSPVNAAAARRGNGTKRRPRLGIVGIFARSGKMLAPFT